MLFSAHLFGNMQRNSLMTILEGRDEDETPTKHQVKPFIPNPFNIAILISLSPTNFHSRMSAAFR
jgi:hypothetical protein